MTNEASRRAFDRAQASYENNMGEGSGTEDFVCPYCGENYSLHWQGETGSSWFTDEEVCPHCGWPAPTDDNTDYDTYTEDKDDHEAPCLVCGVLAHSVGYTGGVDEIQKLSCGHWMADQWWKYAEVYEDYQRMKSEVYVGLGKISEFDEFVRQHPKAGEEKKMTNLQRIAEALAEYEEARRTHDTKKINETYTVLNELPCGRHLNLKESHTGSRLWFRIGIMETRFFWRDGVLQPGNDSWTSWHGPFYFVRIDESTGERIAPPRDSFETRTWDECVADAQEKINILLKEED